MGDNRDSNEFRLADDRPTADPESPIQITRDAARWQEERARAGLRQPLDDPHLPVDGDLHALEWDSVFH